MPRWKATRACAFMLVESSNSCMTVTDFLWLGERSLRYNVQSVMKRASLEARSATALAVRSIQHLKVVDLVVSLYNPSPHLMSND
ncbi:uncharacterized protein F5147DRAFT_709545 [Suillus discolor]|uniref:Uncharacterized protein n=1 Tax=Suillus discolor TaxID=1912936 RepID=A0A9P7JR43_9AGAM|nr:uncharacterized protein F5147DRAFT_709545 [Suillus discolor]KAG2101044.1 hypothetical protein F5147DRAFT_709545 [Suillus discolor]